MFRSMLDWEWYGDVTTKIVFIHLLLTANYKDRNWQGIVVKRGQKITSIKKLADELNISERNVRTAINHLKSTGEVTSTSTSKFTVISIKNYDLYQASDKQSDKQVTNERQTNDKQVTTNKKDNNENNCNKEINNNCCNADFENQIIFFGEHNLVKLSNFEQEKLLKKIDYSEFYKYIDKLDYFIFTKNAKVNNHYETILKWLKEDEIIE